VRRSRAANIAAPHAKAQARQLSLIAIVDTRSAMGISKQLPAFSGTKKRRTPRLFLFRPRLCQVDPP